MLPRADTPAVDSRDATHGRMRGAAVVGTWCVITLLVLAVQPWRAVHGWYGTDWMSFVTGSRLLRDGAGPLLYDAAAQLREQTAVIGQPPVAGLDPYPLFPLFALAIEPLAALPPQLSTAIWSSLMAACVVAAVAVLAPILPQEWDARRRWATALTAVALLPLVDSVAWGQVTPLLLLALAAAVRVAVRRGDSALCGALLAVVALKPQLVWLAVALLVVAGARRTLAGFAAGAAVWGTTTVVLVGTDGVRRWVFELLPDKYASQTADGATATSLLTFLGVPERLAVVASLCVAAAVVALAWRHRDLLRADLPAVLCAGVALSAALAPHGFARDLALVAPGLVLLARTRSRTAIAIATAIGAAYLVDYAMGSWGEHLEAAVELAGIAVLVASTRSPRARRTARATTAAAAA